MTLAATLAAAVVVGLLLGLLGGGGSILTVPVLLYVAGQAPPAAIAASLFVVGVTSAVALIPHALAGRVHWRTGSVFGLAGLAGAYAGGRLAGLLPATVLLTGFGLLMAVAATVMIRSCRRPPRPAQGERRTPALAGLGLAVGLITGMVGAGGGFVIVPALVLLAGLPMTAAVATSLLAITLQAAAGLAGHLQHAAHLQHLTIDWPLTVAVTILAITGSLAGARWSGHVRPQVLRTGFGWFLVATAALVLVEQAPAVVRHALGSTTGGRVVVVAACLGMAVAAGRHVHACRTGLLRER